MNVRMDETNCLVLLYLRQTGTQVCLQIFCLQIFALVCLVFLLACGKERNGYFGNCKPSMSQRINRLLSPHPDSCTPRDENRDFRCMRSTGRRLPGRSHSKERSTSKQLIRKRISVHTRCTTVLVLAFVVQLSKISASGLQCHADARVAAVVLAHRRPGALRTALKSLKQALTPAAGFTFDVALYISIDSNPRAFRYAFRFPIKSSLHEDKLGTALIRFICPNCERCASPFV
jgi:hypothetical protein